MDPQHFTFEEMTATSTGLVNTPRTWGQLANLIGLAYFLDKIRDEFKKPIRINCAFRSPAVNAKVGGVSTSAHLEGRAADICAWSGKEDDNRALLKILEQHLPEIDQLISYHKTAGDVKKPIRFIHVGVAKSGTSPRNERLLK